ncbi:dienelactone hydrolase family protein [Phenylobacterium sp. 20VBR1]|uniref:Dienelactone hydrolase family protein n=2 Tax=Phenylobacterium glaciei TaxID=2803784 RepID=A0A941HVX5_9CAUL|nr:dienelactone hydrolase family protein [Phenylobacterium glaciei]MBR7619173.1 dienelactone hydrolase family protein [Phenylobacterium glaciei]
MPTQDIDYTADGAALVGRLFRPDGKANGAAVLVAHEGPGLSDHTYTIAARLADLGYIAFALDYHGGGQAVGMDVARSRIGAWLADPTGIRARATAALAVLTAQAGVDPARVAGIGYCFGGTTVLELARSGATLAAVVGFHSGLGTARPQDAANIKGKVLTLIGTADPLIPPEQRVAFEAEMRAAKVDWQMHLFGGVAHSFTNPEADGSRMPGILYDAGADARSWREMRALFAETIDR